MPIRRFELSDGNSNEFWEVSADGSAVNVRFGRIGTAGQLKTKDHGSPSAATAEVENFVREMGGELRRRRPPAHWARLRT